MKKEMTYKFYEESVVNLVKTVRAALDKHRKEAYLTCSEDCICWDISEIVENIDTDKFKKGLLK